MYLVAYNFDTKIWIVYFSLISNPKTNSLFVNIEKMNNLLSEIFYNDPLQESDGLVKNISGL